MVRSAMKAGKENDWSELLKSKDLNAWSRMKEQECYEVRQEDDRRKSEQSMQKEHGFLEADRCASPRAWRESRFRTFAFIAAFRLHQVGLDEAREIGATGGTRRAAASACRTARTPARRMWFGPRLAPPQGACENLVCLSNCWRISNLSGTMEIGARTSGQYRRQFMICR